MSVIAELLKFDGERLHHAVQEAGQNLDRVAGEMILDFSSLRRIDPRAVRALEAFAETAVEKAVKVVLRGVSVNIYIVLKLVKLAPRCSFAN